MERCSLADLHSMRNGIGDPEGLELGRAVHEVLPRLLREDGMGDVGTDLQRSLVHKCLH